MSNLKASLSFVKFLHELCGGPSYYKSHKLSERDTKVSADAIKLWFCVIRDCVCVGKDANAYEGRLKKLVTRVFEADLFAFLQSLDLVSEYLLMSVEDKSLRDYDRLKADVVKRAPEAELLSDIVGLTRTHVLGWFQDSSVAGFATAYQVFAFLKRLNLEDDSLRVAAFENWWACEKGFSAHRTYDGDEQTLIEEWFPIENTALLFESFYPHHGSGSTYEGVRANGEKYLLNGLDDNLTEFLKIVGWDPEFTGLMGKPWLYPVKPCRRHKVQFVPKNWKTYRTVSKEPIAYMFMQEGAATSIFSYLKRRMTRISAYYCVDTEERNRKLAQEGSIDGKFATIDLSNASDTVALDLAQQWCSKSALCYYVDYLRTTYAEFDDHKIFDMPLEDVVQVEKFAPMGSALCFPIESIVFCAITASAVRHTPGADHRIAVYGDDIVCDVKAVPYLLNRLQELGFTPNTSKSYFNSGESSDFFRESCGGEYLNGIDITPKRISRKFDGFSSEESRSIAQLIALANDLYDLKTAREYVLYELLHVRKLPIFFDETGEKGIKTPNPQNTHLDYRWNSDYQYWEVECITLFSRRKQLVYHEDAYLGEVRLFEYLRLAEMSHREHLLDPLDLVDVRMDPYSTELDSRFTWEPLIHNMDQPQLYTAAP